MVRVFIDSKVTPLLLLAALLVGGFAVLQLPREEEPQIKVPMVDIFVRMEGASPREVEERVAKPMEKFLWEIPGVEYVYSTSSSGTCLVVVRFAVGHDDADALVRVNQKMSMHFDLIPPGVTPPLIKPRSIDDVPILALTLWSPERDHFTLRRLAGEVADAVKAVPDVSETMVLGGRPREVRVVLDPAALAAHGASPAEVLARLAAANARARSGALAQAGTEVLIETGTFLRSAADVEQVVVGVRGGRPVHVGDVARVEDGADEPTDYVFHLAGAGDPLAGGAPPGALLGTLPEETPPQAAVTVAVAKRRGTNAVDVAAKVRRVVAALRGERLPEDVRVTVTRDYGETAAEKANELLLHMGIAVVSVTLLIWMALGWRESGIVAIAIPVTLALTLAFFYLLGFTLNRITLFALIFSIGILVDDPIVDVENIVRHFRLPTSRGRNLLEVTIEAINEVRSPLILATLTVVCAVLPMGFVRGLMGPYMRPIPVGSSAAMLVSMLVAFAITPWAAYRVLRGAAARGTLGGHAEAGPEAEGWSTRGYRRVMGALIGSAAWRRAFLVAVGLLLAGALALVPFGAVVLKMLPFDNKSEFSVIVDLPEGATLERTANLALELAQELRRAAEVRDLQVYAGTAAPFNFNGLVRHYFLRRGANVAEVQVNLVGKHERAAQSHAVAKRVRPGLEAIARRGGARIKIAEVPPGPPVLSTLVAEVYGNDPVERRERAQRVRAAFAGTAGVVDVDWYEEEEQPRAELVVDARKAALHGVSVAAVEAALGAAVGGRTAGLLHHEGERESVPITARLPQVRRATLDDALSVRVRGEGGALTPIRELARVEWRASAVSIYHKNLLPVIYVVGDVCGGEESPTYAILALRRRLAESAPGGGAAIEGAGSAAGAAPGMGTEYWLGMPLATEAAALKWDGEMHITLEVFRDLGLAFAAVLVLIYVLVVAWFRSFLTPLVIMAAIPFSLVGILPAHAALGVYFTATSMIGFIAGAGIVVRNSIILVDFIELRRAQGMHLAEAVVDAGAVRFRPMLLTAAAVMGGAGVILVDPIFQGLALSLIAGEVASMLLSRMTVPVLYYLRFRSATLPGGGAA
ncbi:MAG: efflux RND transporter permease subunit [Planctomycetes bacterium]|nr:efflux RND transporter permease subunit [Planctomycetota bacterium]